MSDTPPRHFQLPAGRGRGTKRPAEQDLSSSSSSSSSRDTSSSHGSSRDLTWSNTSTINLSSSSNDTITLSSGNNTIWLSSDEEPRQGTSGVVGEHGGGGETEGDSDAPTHSWTSSCDRGHEPSSSSSEGRGHWYQEYLNNPRVLDQQAIDYWEEVERQGPPVQHSRQQKKKK